MSRIGKLPVQIPDGITVSYENRVVTVKGSKGELTVAVKRGVDVNIEDKTLIVTRKNETKSVKALHGTVRNLISNSIKGVSEGFSKTLELVGIGYRVRLDGKELNLSLGYSHPIIFKEIPGITYQVDGQNKIIISGIDKQLVGQVSANIRTLRPPEPYKGKGIKYENEVIVRKAGKTSKGE